MSQQPSAHSQALFKAGLAAEARHNYLEALSKYTASLEPGDGHLHTWIRIGNLFLRTMKYQQAAETMEFALGMDPQNIEAIYGLAIAYFYLGRHEEARAFIDHAAETQPDNSTYALDRANIHSITRPDPPLKRQLYEAWGQRFADPLGKHAAPFDNDRSPDRVLRIGYVSGDMRDHAIAYFMEPVFAHHNPARVEIFVYSTSQQQDAVTARLKTLVPHWHDVSALNDDALHKLIRQHRIDILVDLSGHTHGHRLLTFARRAAPVQVTWLGYIGSTLGMQAMDYRLTDWGMDPPGNEQFYVEKLFRLHCMASYIPPTNTPLEPVPPMLQGNPPTLASLNSSRKLSDAALLVWKRILDARPDAQLLIHVQEQTVEDAVNTIEPRLARLALPLDRIIVSPMVPMDEFMTRGQIVDIALDSFPVSGGTTTLHTLWMGLPVIAMDASDAVASSTAATLKGLGLEDWVAKDEDDYVQKVLELLDHPERLAAHRAEARRLMQQSALMDYATTTRELDSSYRRLWYNYLLGEPRLLHVYAPCKAEHAMLCEQYAREEAR